MSKFSNKLSFLTATAPLALFTRASSWTGLCFTIDLPTKSSSRCALGFTKRQKRSVLRSNSYVNMAESEGAAASVESEQTSEAMSLKAVVIGGTGAVGRCLLGDLLSSKVVINFHAFKIS